MLNYDFDFFGIDWWNNFSGKIIWIWNVGVIVY